MPVSTKRVNRPVGPNSLGAWFLSRRVAIGKFALFAAKRLVYVTTAMSELAEEKLLGHSGDDALTGTDCERREH